MNKEYDVVIIGGGISGAALLYVLSNYTNIKKIALIEKHKDYAQVASHYTQNSQTLHFGDIETNYTYDKAKSVNKKAELVKNYIEKHKDENLFSKSHKMAIGVGKEANFIRQRYKEIKAIYPKIKLLEKEEIAKYEPKVILNRKSDQDIAAIFSQDGYTMNYYELAKSFINHINKKGKEIDLNLEVDKITKESNHYIIKTSKKEFKTKFLICDAGAMSIKFAKDLGYGKHLTIMSLAGNFYRGPESLNGKVYTWQHPKRPNAALHGDPDIISKGYTRFGPTAKILFMLERRNYSTVKDYFKAFNYSLAGWLSIFKVGFDPDYFFYMLKNYLIEIPLIGKIIISKDIKKIIPSIKWWQIKKDKEYGGTRPQIINTKTKKVELGEARITAENAIFNVTPSPGASTCLANAKDDTRIIIKALKNYKFNEKEFDKDLS